MVRRNMKFLLSLNLTNFFALSTPTSLLLILFHENNSFIETIANCFCANVFERIVYI